MDATFLDENGKPQYLEMGCYGIGISRVGGAAIEQKHDDKGIIWPEAIAPFEAVICPMNYHKSDTVRTAADKLYAELLAAGVDVILDDREMRAGPMFADWELIGVPHRFVVGERGLKNGEVEYAARSNLADKKLLKVQEAAARVAAIIKKAKEI